MREILFRGKCCNSGEWVYGFAVIHDNHAFILTPTDASDSGVGIDSFPVDPSTVGQDTGLTDKNGKKIFEGDIVRNHNGQIYEMVFIEKYNCYYFVRESSVYAGIKPKDIEVIGNIHDNPELLEVEE